MNDGKYKKLNKTLIQIAIFAFLAMTLLIILAAGAKGSMENQNENERNSKIGIPYSASIYTEQQEDVDYATFTGIGQLRIATKQDPFSKTVSTLVINPWFSYTKGDEQFVEELSRKTLFMKNEITKYVQNKTKQQLKSLGEEKVKSDLKDIFNKELVLNKIKEIYFSQYIFLD